MRPTHVFAVVVAHELQEHHAAHKVVVIVLDGLGIALTHSLVAGKVDDAVKPGAQDR